MANENGGNGLWGTIGIIILVLLLIWVVGSLIKGEWNPAKWFGTVPSAKTDFEKCLEKIKSSKEGDACVSCVDTEHGQTGAVFNGVINNKGECVPRQQTAPPVTLQIEIVNTNGAIIYSRDAQGNFISARMANRIPFGTKLTVLAMDKTPASYYNTSMGWVSVNDVKIMF